MKISISRYIILATGMLALAACTGGDEPGRTDEPTAQLTVSVADAGFGSDSRAEELDGYRTEFTEGDACGLYLVRDSRIVYDNVKLTATADDDGAITWQPEEDLNGGLDGESYFLYYPYKSDLSEPSDLSDLSDLSDAAFFRLLIAFWQPAADQSDYADYTASDLMTAKGRIVRSGASKAVLSFEMTHRMGLAVIELPQTVYKFKEAGIPYYVTSSAADFTDSSLKPCRMADGTYRYIVNPFHGAGTCLTGYYADGSKEFTFTPSATQGSYKTYTIDGLTPTEKQATLQMGDYFCKNSDNYWYIIPQESEPDGNVIGIVFHAGQHNSDNADYSATGIGQEKCHGYVVALTDVGLCRWAYKDGAYSQEARTSKNTNDWKGYGNQKAIENFAGNNTADWKFEHFEAAYRCSLYGTEKGEDWQRRYAAPVNTSGWFLPSCNQLTTLYNLNHELAILMENIKSQDPSHIRWFNTGDYYWSSTEHSLSQDYAWGVNFSTGESSNRSKSRTYDVRAVLAF